MTDRLIAAGIVGAVDWRSGKLQRLLWMKD